MGDLNDKQGGLQHMGGKTLRSKALLPIPTVQTAQALVRLYGRLKGELSKASAGEDVLIPVGDVTLHMSRIIGLMPLLGIDFDPEAVKTRVQIGPLKWGNLRSGTLAVLRHRGDWMTYREIADALLARNRKAKALDVAQMSKFVQKVREALFFQMKAGAVERELEIGIGVSDQHQRFRLSQTLFRMKTDRPAASQNVVTACSGRKAPAILTEVRHHHGPLGGADIGCCGTERRFQLNASSMWRSGHSSAKIEHPDPTQRRRWHFLSRAAGPLSKQSFADHVEKSAPCDSGRSQVATAVRNTSAAERLHLKAANSRCRP